MKLDTISEIVTELAINGIVVDAIDVVTMRGLETLASCLGSPFNFTKAWMPYIAIGSGLTEPSTENEYLEAELYRSEASISYNKNAYIATVTFDESAAYVLREAGLLNAAQGGVLAARWVTAVDYNIEIADTVSITCTIYIT
jgi:hypothetical protein